MVSGDKGKRPLVLPAIIPSRKPNYIERREGCKGARMRGIACPCVLKGHSRGGREDAVRSTPGRRHARPAASHSCTLKWKAAPSCTGSEGLLSEIPPAVTYFPTQSPKQYRRR